MSRFSTFTFSVILSAFVADAHAQNPDSSIIALDGIYQKMHTDNETPTDKSLAAIEAAYQTALPLFDNTAKGNIIQRNTGRFIEALIKAELGFAYKAAGQKQKAYGIYLDNDKVFEYVKNTAQFPLEFTYSGIIHTFTKSSFDQQYYQFYSSFGVLCKNMNKFPEAKIYLNRALKNPTPELYFTYQCSVTLWSAKRQTKKIDSEYVSFTLQALKSWARTDQSLKDTISKKHYFAVSDFATELIYIIPQSADLKNKAMAYLTAAYYLDSTKQDNYTADFYRYAMQEDSSSRAVLWQIYGYAKRTGNNELALRAENNISKVYATEPDEAVRNLGFALQEIVPDASDPARHLADIRGRSFNVKNIGGKTYKSSVQLKGAMVTYTYDFLKNSQHNYYYWNVVIDDEKPANLQGKLSARYKALCEETKNLYPQSHSYNRYEGLNHFVAEINRYVTIEISYFNNGANDRIIYSVISEMGKEVK